MLDKNEVSDLLENFADLLEFKGENPFKIRAFRFGANAIKNIEGDLDTKVEDGSIKDVKGIGKGILAILKEVHDTGKCMDYENLLSSIPKGIMDLFQIRGLGIKKIRTLHDTLGINDIDDLAEAAVEDKIAAVTGFGMKTQEKIVAEIARIKSSEGLIHYYRAIELGDSLLNDLMKIKSVTQGELTGELRRGVEVISAIEILLCVNDETKFISELDKLYKFREMSDEPDNYLLFDINLSIIVKVFYVNDVALFQSTLLRTTGSKEFLKGIGYKYADSSTKRETDIFDDLDVSYVIPEMREAEILEAPVELRKNSELNQKDLLGLLHFHTKHSDGLNTLAEMGAAAKLLGYQYAAVCDHSKTAFYANGLTEERILIQKKELRELSNNKNIMFFQGIESDILNDGSLDYSNEFLSNFDFIVASVHSGFNLSEENMTKRVIKALEIEFTDVLGHPTGRLLLSRNPYKIDTKKIIDACAANNVAIEINSNPFRLDLDWRLIFYAREKGCKFAINPDAHSVEGIKDVSYGIKMAKKGGLQKEEVINCLSIDDFKSFLKRKVNRKLI
ncbi:helix-hairpin-helix domain-containing protein [Bacteroidota bacterium]